MARDAQMTNYLVVVRTNLDELPIRLCASKAEAVKRARNVTQKQIDKAAKLMRVDSAGVCNVSIMGFRKSGLPFSLECIKRLGL